MKKLDNLIAEEYKNVLTEQEILKSNGELILKEWVDARNIIKEEEDKGVVTDHPDEEWGKRKPGQESKLSAEDALTIFGNTDESSGWNTDEEQKIFKLLWNYGAIPTHIIDELYWLKIPTIRGDLYSFEPSLEMYSYQTMGTYDYEFENNQLKIINKIPDGTPPSAICKPESPTDKCPTDQIAAFAFVNKAKYGYVTIPNLSTPAEKKPEEKNNVIDTIQTVLDWLGLIPGIGDAIDAINAVIYFARGKYLEGAFSLLAVIPVVGSVLALALKNGFKLIKGAAKMIKGLFKLKNIKNAGKAIKSFKSGLLAGKVSPKMVKILGEWGPYMGKKIKGVSNLIKKIPGISTKFGKRVSGYFDEMANGLNIMGNAAKDIRKLKAVERLAKKMAKKNPNAKGIREFIKKTSPKYTEYIAKTTNNRMSRLFGLEFGPYLKSVARAIDNKFIRTVAAGPTSAFIKAVPGSSRLISKELQKYSNEIISKGLINKKDLASIISLAKRNRGQSAEQAFGILKKVAPGSADTIGKQIGETLVKNNDRLAIAYREAASTDWTKLQAILSPTDMDNISRVRKKLLNNYALWYNEIEDLLEKLGADDVDNVNGVVLANFYYGLRKFAPDAISQGIGSAATYAKSGVAYIKNWANPNSVDDILKAVGVGKAGPLMAGEWNSSYPGMTAKEKVYQTLRINPGKEDIVMNNYKKIIDDGGQFEDDGTILTQADIDDIYNEYSETNPTLNLSQLA